ncbi:bacterioferritin-associated ferredoxin [Marinagarivorans algicola]|uniref:bacterioferritin-associated ferredoxin n=2 Tax=Marinagarivorans algicola TaxID=1513270 RepID=UPI0030832BBC
MYSLHQAIDEILMYVCLCQGITDSQIRSAVESGANSLRDVRERLGVMTQCGKCACLTKDIVEGCLEQANTGIFYSAS